MKLPQLLILMLCSVYCQAQIKIGNITIDNATAKEYFADCYLHPDTVKMKHWTDFLPCNGCILQEGEIQRAKLLGEEFDDNIKKYNIGEVTKTDYVPKWTDTVYNKSMGLIYTQSEEYNDKENARRRAIEVKSGIKEIRKHPAYTNVYTVGYLMPRKPSEQDFIKWCNRK